MVVAGAAVNDATVPVNADTLGGRPANDYVTDEEVVYYSGDIAIDETVPLNADTLQGYKASDFATADWVKSEIANAQLGGGSGEGEIDLSGFALKADVTAEIDNKISNIDYPVDSVNGKTGNVQLSASDVGAVSTSTGIQVYSRADIGTSPNFDNPGVNGLFEIRSSTETPGESGNKPFNSFGPFLNLKTPDNIAMMQIAGDSTGANYYIRSRQAGNVSMKGLSWRTILTNENIAQFAAPAGFGLGNTQRIEVGDIDNIFQNGWYCFAGNYTPQNTTYTYGFLCISSWNVNSFEQTLFPVSEHCEVLRRFKVMGHWLPWEYVNTPMQLGVEYRTTERYCGKPVYVMAYNAGSMPSGTAAQRTSLPSYVVGNNIIDLAVRINNAGATMQLAYGGDPAFWIEEKRLLCIRTSGDFSGYTVYVTVKYTKD